MSTNTPQSSQGIPQEVPAFSHRSVLGTRYSPLFASFAVKSFWFLSGEPRTHTSAFRNFAANFPTLTTARPTVPRPISCEPSVAETRTV